MQVNRGDSEGTHYISFILLLFWAKHCAVLCQATGIGYWPDVCSQFVTELLLSIKVVNALYGFILWAIVCNTGLCKLIFSFSSCLKRLFTLFLWMWWCAQM